MKKAQPRLRFFCCVDGRSTLHRLPHGLAQLVHRRRIEEAAVVAREHVEVTQADAVFGRLAGRGQIDHQHFGFLLACGIHTRSQCQTSACEPGQRHAGIRLAICGGGRNALAIGIAGNVPHHGAVRLPAMHLQEAGNAANGIHRAVAQIDVAVAIVIDGVFANAGRHELRNAHCARIRAQDRERVRARVAAPEQEVLQLIAEHRAAVFAVGRVGVVESQRGQRVNHAEVAHVPAVDGLHAKDAHDHIGRHAEFVLGAAQCVAVLLPEPHACADADRLNEAAAIGRPAATRGCGRRQDQARHRGGIGCARKQRIERCPVKVVLRDQHADEGLRLRVVAITIEINLFFMHRDAALGRFGGLLGRQRERRERECGERCASHQGAQYGTTGRKRLAHGQASYGIGAL